MTDAPTAPADALNEIERRIGAHPAHQEHVRCVGFARTIEVFNANLIELTILLDRASTDQRLAIELIQNQRRPNGRRAFAAAAVQRLHNYVASAMTLVDHSRRVMRGRTGPIDEEFAARKESLLANPEVPFVNGLRNYALHRALPCLRYEFGPRQPSAEASDVKYGCEVQLSVTQLLEWDEWSTVARIFIEGQGRAVPLRRTIARHGEIVGAVNTWLLAALVDANAGGIAEVNEMIARYNALLEKEARKASATA